MIVERSKPGYIQSILEAAETNTVKTSPDIDARADPTVIGAEDPFSATEHTHCAVTRGTFAFVALWTWRWCIAPLVTGRASVGAHFRTVRGVTKSGSRRVVASYGGAMWTSVPTCVLSQSWHSRAQRRNIRVVHLTTWRDSEPLGDSPPRSIWAGVEHSEGLGKSPRNVGGEASTVAAAQDCFQRWWASSLSTLAHVKECENLGRTARACEGRKNATKQAFVKFIATRRVLGRLRHLELKWLCPPQLVGRTDQNRDSQGHREPARRGNEFHGQGSAGEVSQGCRTRSNRHAWNWRVAVLPTMEPFHLCEATCCSSPGPERRTTACTNPANHRLAQSAGSHSPRGSSCA